MSVKKIVIYALAAIVVGCGLWYFLRPEKDYRQLAIGRWYEKQTEAYADVTYDTITMTRGKFKETIGYELIVDKDPMEIIVWRGRDKRKTYTGIVEFKNDDKVTAKKLPSSEDRGDYVAERLNQWTSVWERVKED